MDFITGVNKKDTLEISEIVSGDYTGKEIKINGSVHSIRDMGDVAFVILRKREGLIQCVYEEGKSNFALSDIRDAATVEIIGTVNEEERAPHGIEVRIKELKILSLPTEPMPLPIAKWKLNTSLEAKLNNRSAILRNIKERAKFKLSEGIVRGFRDFLYSEGFTEIHTPKIGAKGAEGGARRFSSRAHSSTSR